MQKASNTRSKTQEKTLWAANATTIGLTIIRFQGDFKLNPPSWVMFQGERGMQLPLTAQNSAIKRCPQCRRPCIIWQHVTFCSRYTFLMVSNPDRIAPGRRLPESTQSTLHHYFIRSHADINAYLLIIDKFLLIRYQATVKQSTLFFADGSWPACRQTSLIVFNDSFRFVSSKRASRAIKHRSRSASLFVILF